MVSFKMTDGVVSDIVGDESEVDMVKDTVEFCTDDFKTYKVDVNCEDGYVYASGYGDDGDMIDYLTWVGE